MVKDSPRRFSKQWVRENWDYEQETGPRLVQLVKLIHEFHIAIPGTIATLVVCYTLWAYDVPELRIILTGFGTFGTGYALFFGKWWCSTLSDGYGD